MSYEPRLQALTERLVKFNTDRHWSQFHTPKDLAIALNLEASELLEHFQWMNQAEMTKHIADHKTGVGEELADALYTLLLMGHYFDIDIIAALEAKMAQNEAKYPVEKANNSRAKYTEFTT